MKGRRFRHTDVTYSPISVLFIFLVSLGFYSFLHGRIPVILYCIVGPVVIKRVKLSDVNYSLSADAPRP